MNSRTIRFDLTKAEQKKDGCVIGFTFSIGGGDFAITEHWQNTDELYSDGCIIVVPPRIWALALPWIIENSKG